MLALWVLCVTVSVCDSGGVSLSDLWSSSFSLPDPWTSGPADKDGQRASTSLQGWQKKKLEEYKDRVEDQERREELALVPEVDDPWVLPQDVQQPFPGSEPPAWRDSDRGPPFSALHRPDTDVIVTSEGQLSNDVGYSVFPGQGPEIVPSDIFRRPRFPPHGFAFGESPHRSPFFREEQGGFNTGQRLEIVPGDLVRRPRHPFFREGQQTESSFNTGQRLDVVSGELVRKRRSPPVFVVGESPLGALLASRPRFERTKLQAENSFNIFAGERTDEFVGRPRLPQPVIVEETPLGALVSSRPPFRRAFFREEPREPVLSVEDFAPKGFSRRSRPQPAFAVGESPLSALLAPRPPFRRPFLRDEPIIVEDEVHPNGFPRGPRPPLESIVHDSPLGTGSSFRAPFRREVLDVFRPRRPFRASFFEEPNTPGIFQPRPPFRAPFLEGSNAPGVFQPQPFAEEEDGEELLGAGRRRGGRLRHRGPAGAVRAVLDAVQQGDFAEPPSVFGGPSGSFRDAVLPRPPFSPLRGPARSFLRLLDSEVGLNSVAEDFFSSRRQELFGLLSRVVGFCGCRKTLDSLKNLWGVGEPGQVVLSEEPLDEDARAFEDLGLPREGFSDNFREILSGKILPPNTIQGFRVEFLGGLLDSVCRSAKSFIADVQSNLDGPLEVTPVV